MRFSPLVIQTSAAIAILLASISVAQGAPPVDTAKLSVAHIPLLFEANVGQTDSKVRFLARSGRYRIYLSDESAVLKIAGENRDAVLRTSLIGANSNARISGIDPQPSKTNYLLGSQALWKTGIPNYGAAQYHSVYPGIDLKYYGKQQQLEYDFSVAPQADVSAIAFKIEGANDIRTSKDGDLVLETAAGEVRWLQPLAYQQYGTERRLVSASYRVKANVVSFDLGAYDRNRTLVIDPALVYGTYLDGKSFEGYNGILVDSAGYVYVVGNTGSADYPITPGAYQKYQTTNFSGEVYVSKLSQDGSSLVWSTIIGGTGTNNYSGPNGFTLDSSGNIYVVGFTEDFTYVNGQLVAQASTFPTTAGAYNRNALVAPRHFLVKLNNSGSGLDFSTFLSDQPNIIGYAVAADAAGAVYVTGSYNHGAGLTAPFPATRGAFQATLAGDNDAFVMKFNPQGSALDYATLVGGIHDDVAYQIQVDSARNATIDGPTYSTNFPITPNGKRQTDEGGFITTVNSAGTGLLYSTVLNHVLSINVKRDLAGYYYAGGSAGISLPTTSNAFQKTFPATGSGIHLGFVTEIDPSGNLVYSSYLAGNTLSSEDTQIQFGTGGAVVLSGDRFNDRTFPVTDRTYEQDNCSFLAKFNTQANGKASLVYSGCTPINLTNNTTYNQFRGIPYFNGAQLHLDSHNNLYAISTAGPTSSNAFQKVPPQQTSGNGSFVWIGKYNLNAPDTGGVNLSEPYNSGPPYNPPVTFRATGRSPQCSSGVAAMRVYSAPGVVAYTTQGATLDANISFPPTNQVVTNNAVIVVYDNCGKAFSKTVPVNIQGPANVTNPQIISPTTGGVVTSPVHFVANTSASTCSKGVAALRIYTAPGVAAYNVNGGSLDTYLNLAPGTYNAVVQEWDNCGGVFKTPVSFTVE
ncbi:MAG: SBBP repeat-containing protein [Acidobacteriota bacterium]|nr:SBBP repeat-containing protein [Acidobacteriota bacterium]